MGNQATLQKKAIQGLNKNLGKQVNLMNKHEKNDANVMKYQRQVTATEKSIAQKTDRQQEAYRYLKAIKDYEKARNLVKNMYAMDPGLCCTGVSAFSNGKWKAAFSSARNRYEADAMTLKKLLKTTRPKPRATELVALAFKLRASMAAMKDAASKDPVVKTLLEQMEKDRLLVEQALATMTAGNKYKPLRTAEFLKNKTSSRSQDLSDQLAGLLGDKIFSDDAARKKFNDARAKYQKALADLKKRLADKTTTNKQLEAQARIVQTLRRAMQLALESDKGWRTALAGLGSQLDKMYDRLGSHGVMNVAKAKQALEAADKKNMGDCRKADNGLLAVIKSTKDQIKNDSKNNPFYTLDKHGALVWKNWQVTPGLFSAGKPTTTSIPKTGTMSSASFAAKANTLAFTVGGGDKATTVTLQVLRDFSGPKVIRKFVGKAGSFNREVFWDISEYNQDMLRLIVSDQSTTAGIFFSNVRMFDDTTVSCIPDCIQIKESMHRTYKSTFVAFDIMGERYTAADTRDRIEDGKRVQYCRIGNGQIGRDGGASLAALKIAPLKADIRSILTMSPCVHIEPYRTRGGLPGSKGYVLSLGENPRRQFLFQQKFPKAHNGKAPSSVPNLMCIYPTSQPRCAEYSGVVKERRSVQVNCVTQHPNPDCFESIFETQCGADKNCGEKKGVQDMLVCCDKHKHVDGHACHHNRRRLSSADSAMKFKDFSLDGNTARDCAERCMRKKGCVAWNVDKVSGMCTLTDECLTKPGRGTENLEWMMLPGVQKKDLFKNAQVSADGRIKIQSEKWTAN